MTFATRRQQHDDIALTAVASALERHGALTSMFGIELDNETLRKALREQHDAMSLMLRYRPDRAVVVPHVQTVLCEVKSVTGAKRNYAIEVDSYMAAAQWNNADRKVMYAFVDLDTDPPTLKACWFDALPQPACLYVPKRPGYEQTLHRLDQAWPGVEIVTRDWLRGSGTPYFLVWKGHPQLHAFDVFCSSLMGDVDAP